MLVKEILEKILKEQKEIKTFIKNSNNLDNRISRVYHIKLNTNGTFTIPHELRKMLQYELETSQLYFDLYMTPERIIVLMPTIETEDDMLERMEKKKEERRKELGL